MQFFSSYCVLSKINALSTVLAILAASCGNAQGSSCGSFDEESYAASQIASRYRDRQPQMKHPYREIKCFTASSDDNLTRACVLSFVSNESYGYVHRFLIYFDPTSCGNSEPDFLRDKVKRDKFDGWFDQKVGNTIVVPPPDSPWGRGGREVADEGAVAAALQIAA